MPPSPFSSALGSRFWNSVGRDIVSRAERTLTYAELFSTPVCDACANRKFVDQLKASRDELAAASKTDGSDAALATLEKRSLLTQKASIEKMAAEARR